jgi:hypothetical protein
MNDKIDKLPDGDMDEMQPEYDFSGGVRGKHYHDFQRGYKVLVHKPDGTTEERDYTLPEGAIMLDPDVRAYFSDGETVNTVLRGLINLIPHERTSTEVS